MTEQQRKRVVALLPSEFEASESCLPQGDAHRRTTISTEDALRSHFDTHRRSIYISADKAIYYPGEPMFSPDVFAVLDVEDRERDSWIVKHEGKGLDLCIEIAWAGSRAKDIVQNVKRFARLGIREYFVFDMRRSVLKGYRLMGSQMIYTRLLPQHGRFWSEVLELDLAIEGRRLRFFHGVLAVPHADERFARLGELVGRTQQRVEAEARKARSARRQARSAKRHACMARDGERQAIRRAKLEAARANKEAKRADTEAMRAHTEAKRAARAEQELAEARATIEALKRT